MQPFIIQDTLNIEECLASGSGAAQIGTFIMPDDDVADFAGIRILLLAIVVFGASAAGGTTRPSVIIETTDDLAGTWTTLWTSNGEISASAVLTLSAELERGQSYRLARYVRWRVVVPTPGSTPSRITFRVTGTVK